MNTANVRAYNALAMTLIEMRGRGGDVARFAWLASDNPGAFIGDIPNGWWEGGVCYAWVDRERQRQGLDDTPLGRIAQDVARHLIVILVAIADEEDLLALVPDEVRLLDPPQEVTVAWGGDA